MIPKTTTALSAPPSDISLSSIYARPDRHRVLYEILKERDPSVNISHKAIPLWWDHVRFVDSHPYEAWYFIGVGPQTCGACYLSRQDEIGVFVFKAFQGQGIGKRAIRALIERHGKRRYLANINPQNMRSLKLFADMGFRPLQHTFEYEPV